MSGLRVTSPGLATTIQDLGRPGARGIGVPRSGALDAGLLRLANALVGNEGHVACLEIRLSGPTLTVEAERVRLAGTGGAIMTITRGDGDPQPLEPWRSVTLCRGETISVRGVTGGTVAYLAVAGGFDLPEVLGSQSTYTRAALGGLNGLSLQANDLLPLLRDSVADGADLAMPQPPRADVTPVRVVLGPQADHFTDGALEDLQGAVFTVGREVDRMGMRLTGVTLEHRSRAAAEIISDAVVPGAIQVPPNGQPIILLADGQTVGGYPKIATIVSADLGRVATLAPGSAVQFVAVTVAEAEDAAREADRRLKAVIAGLEPFTDGLDLRALYENNVIGGVVDAARPNNFPGHLEDKA